MKDKKQLLIIPIVLFPYVIVGLLLAMFFSPKITEWFPFLDTPFYLFYLLAILFVSWLVSLISEIVFGIDVLRGRCDTAKTAKTVCIAKLIQIPAYIFIFISGVLLAVTIFTYVIAILLALLDWFIIRMTTFPALAAIIVQFKRKRIPKGKAIALAIFQFVYVVDIAAAIITYIEIKKGNKMQYVTLGKTNLKISRLGFGGIPIQKIDAAGTRKLFLQMKEAGINFVDTARGYTVSESYIGEALEGMRDSFVLATKSMSRDKEGMAKDIETSLANLRTDYIDLYQIHNPNMEQLEQVLAEGGAAEALLAAKAAGKIGHIGLTAHSLEVFEKALTLDFVETVMFPYNIVETHGTDLIRTCAEKNVGFIAMKPLAGGALEDATLAMRFIAANPDVTVVIPGMADAAEIEQNLAAVCDGTPLTDAENAKITEIRETLGTQFCRRCNYCAPCTVGINIPGVFLMEGYLSRYGLGDWAKDRYEGMAKHASDCIGCGECEPRCPYNLPIREMLRSAAEKFGK